MYESSVRLWKYGNPKHFMKYVVNGNKFLRYDAEHPPCILVYPILEWKTEDVVRFIRESGQPLHEGYKKYGISGCKWCPVHTPDIYARILQERPSFYDDIIELEEYVGRPCVRGGIWLKDIKANPALYIPVDNNRISPV
jgi:3'-phosphoadenosine 5'-phosphosulfate sulfotransferase (PAPS reductase)/FAD synthetase